MENLYSLYYTVRNMISVRLIIPSRKYLLNPRFEATRTLRPILYGNFIVTGRTVTEFRRYQIPIIIYLTIKAQELFGHFELTSLKISVVYFVLKEVIRLESGVSSVIGCLRNFWLIRKAAKIRHQTHYFESVAFGKGINELKDTLVRKTYVTEEMLNERLCIHCILWFMDYTLSLHLYFMTWCCVSQWQWVIHLDKFYPVSL